MTECNSGQVHELSASLHLEHLQSPSVLAIQKNTNFYKYPIVLVSIVFAALQFYIDGLLQKTIIFFIKDYLLLKFLLKVHIFVVWSNEISMFVGLYLDVYAHLIANICQKPDIQNQI